MRALMRMVLGTTPPAVLLNWKAKRPAYTSVVVASVLTKFTLIVAHVIAAAVIVPLVARALRSS